VIPTQLLLFSVTSRGFINLLNDNVNTTKKESVYGKNEEACRYKHTQNCVIKPCIFTSRQGSTGQRTKEYIIISSKMW
jgi:hypothetical protein